MTKQMSANAFAAMVEALPDDERKAGLQRLIAERERATRSERRARIAARKAEKEATMQTTKPKTGWTPDVARSATVQAFDDGYKPVTIIPHTLTKLEKDAGKLPGACYAGKWNREKDWAAVAETATLEASLNWYGQTPSAPNVGILCGVKTERGYLVGVDIDCDAPEVLEGLARLCGGELAVRIGKEGRSGLVPLLVDSLDAPEVFACGGDKIQLLKTGKQFVACGIHPQRLEPYRWARFDVALGEAVGDGDMPSVAHLPRLKLADVLEVFAEYGFRAGEGMAGTKPGDKKARKVELLAILAESEYDGDDYEALFGDDGEFPLSELAEENRVFAKNFAGWGEGYEPDREDISHHSRRVAFYKDLERQWPAFTIAHAKVLHLSGRLPGLGRFTGEKEGDGSITDTHIVSAYYWAEQVIAGERSGEIKQHDSTKPGSKGKEFGAVYDETDEENGETQEQTPEADKAETPTAEESNVVYFDAIRNSRPRFLEWSVKHFIARGTTAVVSGQWGAGKTAVYLDISLHIAAGLNWQGKKVEQGVVIYCGLENPEDIARRVRAWSDLIEGEGHDLSRCAFVQHKGPLSLVDVKDIVKSTNDEKALIRTAKEAAEHFGMEVAMIVIDTVSASIAPGNEKEHAGPYMKSLERISQTTGAHVTALHHPTKAGDPLRGGGEFFGNGDAVILVSRDEKTGVCSIKASREKFRIGDPALVDFRYGLTPHKIGVDEEGEAINVVLAIARDSNSTWRVPDAAEADAEREADKLLDDSWQRHDNPEDCLLHATARSGGRRRCSGPDDIRARRVARSDAARDGGARAATLQRQGSDQRPTRKTVLQTV